jgi:hypothetical protein
LPSDVGAAIVLYLRFGRPRCTCRRVFLRHRAPVRGFAHSITVSTIVRRALIGAGSILFGKEHTYSATRWPRTCSGKRSPSMRSANYSVIKVQTQPPSMRRWT